MADRKINAPLLLWVATLGMVIGGLVRRPTPRAPRASQLILTTVILSLMTFPSCGGGIAGSGGGGGGGGTVSVNINPTAASVLLNQQKQFSATVSGSSNTQVSWQVNGVTGGSPASGTVDPNGLYTAPAVLPNPVSVTVSAISQADVTKSASAIVTITDGSISVTISPTSASLSQNQQKLFTATVSGSTNTQVSWQVNEVIGGSPSSGTIDATGLYTAPAAVPNPATVTVSAVSQADLTKSASAAVTIQSQPTPSGTYTIAVTATAGSSSQSTTARLTIQ